MSVWATTAAWYGSQARGTTKLVLLAIADCANDEGGNAFPSMATIARKCGLQDERSAQRHVRKLEDLGELRVDAGRGRRGANLYHVRMDVLARNSKKSEGGDPGRNATPAGMPPPADSPAEPRQHDRGDPGKSVARTPAGMPPEPSGNRTGTGEGTGTRPPSSENPGGEAEAPAGTSGGAPAGSLPALRERLAELFPNAPSALGRREESLLLADQALLAELEVDDWAALRAWFAEADDEARGCRLWPRSRAEFLGHAGEAVEKVRAWWHGKRGARFRGRRAKRAAGGGAKASAVAASDGPSADFREFAEARGHDPAAVDAAWADGRWQADFARWMIHECDGNS